jgi:ATP-dependent helicase HrpB
VSSGLPIDAALPALRAALATRRAAVLQAAPGAGKSTVVPLALLGEEWAHGKKLLMLEPRRLATRAIATRMARSLDERVGATIGYRMRLDTRVSRSTRVEVITEGVLTRLLQEDPALEGVAALIFDEFHERNLQADLGLALALDARATIAPDLRILVMSATLEASAVARLIGDAPLVSLPTREFALELRYTGRSAPLLPAAQHSAPGPRGPLSAEHLVAQLVVRAMREEPGDLLVFLPGAPEIRRVQALLEASRREVEASGDAVRILPLHGTLASEQQDAALSPAAPGTRKIVLATNIAETGLTVPGVRIVVDSGLMRRARFDPVTGMSRLETQRISRASAEQRAGRAARTAPGVCYRAWSEGAHGSLAAFTPPEISDADLAPLALELASWGIRDAGALRWLDAPPPAMLASARDLLRRLGALDGDGRISAHGREMARLGVHPRLAHMLLRARGLGSLPLAARLAALLSERDLLRADRRGADADIRTRLELLSGEHGGVAVERATLERARRAARDIGELLRPAGPAHVPAGTAAEDGASEVDAGLLLSFAYPDRIGLRRPGGEGRYTLANGRGASFAQAQSLARRELIVAVDLDDRERDARILLAAPLEREALLAHFADHICRRESIHWSAREQAVVARRTLELDALVLEDKPLSKVSVEASRRAMLEGVRELGVEALPWDQAARSLQARIEFMRAGGGNAKDGASESHSSAGSVGGARSAPWPDVSDAALNATLDAWLSAWLDGVTRREHLARIPLLEALRAQLTPAQQRALEQWAPTHLALPGGSRVRVDYVGEHAPAISVRLQEVFGLGETPRLGRTGVPVTLRLLSPAQRPVQVTRDLASFWRGAYAQVRKDLRGRYPKHYWPENPLEAQPTRGVRRPR